MTRASLARLTTGTTTGAPTLELIVGTVIKGLWVRRVEVTLSAATASAFGWGRPAAKGVTPTSPVRLLWEESADPVPDSTIDATTALAWVTPPTVPAQFYRETAMQGVIGQLQTWDFANLWIPMGGSMVLWNLSVVSAAYVNIIVDVQRS